MSLKDLKEIPYGKTAIELKNIFLAFVTIWVTKKSGTWASFGTGT